MFVQVLFVFFLAYAHGLQVNTTEGIVEGSRAVDGDYFAFYGVPYAGPTSGQNRFKMPMPPKPFPGVFRATDSNIFCAQPSSRGLIGIEDCLTLSIFTRNVTSPKPVVVFLNSDEYTNTNNQPMSYRRLVEQNIVFVTMNFRLSIFGFLCLGVQEAPGNAGLKDVLQGLKWIKSNIVNFGGDPNNVILMGHASGGALVDLLTLSPQIENLAHKAIVLSGSALAPWAVGYDPVGYANLLGTKLEYDHKTPQVLAQRLINTDINVLHTALNDFKFFNNTPLFAPCVENPKLSPNHTVLGDAPINILRSGKYVQIPVIYGYTNREGTMRAEEADFGNWLALMQTNFTSFLQVDLKLANNKTAVAASIRDFYFGSSAISMGTIEDFLDYQGDTLVLVSTIRGAKERALTSKSEVRLMEFAYLGTLNSNWIHNQIPLSGAAHGAFLNYLFGYDLRPADEAVSRALVGRVSAFAYNWSNNTWAAITKDSTNYLYYGGNGAPTANNTSIYVEEPRFNPHVQRMSFWNNLYEKFYVAPTQPSSSNIIVSSLLFIMLCQMALRLY